MFKWLKWLKTKKKVKSPTKEGHMYDFRNCAWGHSIGFDGEGKPPNSRKVHGWVTPCVNKGDTFLFPATKGLAVWLLLDVKNCNDPKDMFFATAGIIRYATEEDLQKVGQERSAFSFV